jgi:hypothetical protein
MRAVLTREFLDTIVWVEDFKLDLRGASLKLLCVEGEDTEVNYILKLSDVPCFSFKQKDFEYNFSVIDTILEEFNGSPYFDEMHSERLKCFWVLRFHSGIHHLALGFRGMELLKL